MGAGNGFTPPASSSTGVKQVANEAAAAIAECRNKRLSGELKTYVASADCSNPRILAVYQRAGYRYMDLVQRIAAKRRELAGLLDRGTLTETQEEQEFAQFVARINNEERERDSGRK